MPLPKPKEGESQDEFVDRCISAVFKEGTLQGKELDPDNEADRKQATAACYTQWREGKAVTKKEKDGNHPASHYLVVGDPEKPTTWHLRVKDTSGKPDHRLMGAAWAALHGGYRGNRYEGPDKQDAIAKLRRLYKREGLDAPEGKAIESNALKAISRTDNELRVGNYIVLFDGRDLTGLPSLGTPFYAGIPNPDGSTGEYFTKATDLSSAYTATGMLYVDWEHGEQPDGEDIRQPGRDDVLGIVDWKTARADDNGVWAERVLYRRAAYMQWIEQLIDAGLIGTSSQATPEGIQKSADGEIVKWPLERDTLTVMPFDARMMTDNVLAAVKALAAASPQFKALLPEPKPTDGGGSAGALRQRAIEVRANILLDRIKNLREG